MTFEEVLQELSFEDLNKLRTDTLIEKMATTSKFVWDFLEHRYQQIDNEINWRLSPGTDQ